MCSGVRLRDEGVFGASIVRLVRAWGGVESHSAHEQNTSWVIMDTPVPSENLLKQGALKFSQLLKFSFASFPLVQDVSERNLTLYKLKEFCNLGTRENKER